MMTTHSAISNLVDRIASDAIGGAADIAKETVQALDALAHDSTATTAETFVEELSDAITDILLVLPSLAPPINALHCLMRAAEVARDDAETVAQVRESVRIEANLFLTRAQQALEDTARHGAERIADGDVVFTYSMSSTVWRALRYARDQGKSFSVTVTESRPGNEGLSTVAEMQKLGIPVSLGIDAGIGELVPESELVMVGADAIASFGSILCKVGTYPTALVAKAYGIPFYVLADTLKFDQSTLLGLPFRVDPLPKHEVIIGDDTPDVQVVGSLFDVTPPGLVTAVITERGLFSAEACGALMLDLPRSETVTRLLPDWAHRQLRREPTSDHNAHRSARSENHID